MQEFTDTFSITFGDQAENNVGMEKIGTPAGTGLTLQDLLMCQAMVGPKSCELINLNDKLPPHMQLQPCDAHVLIIKNGVNLLLGPEAANKMYDEQKQLPLDKKALMRGKVKNKHARWNLCYGDVKQEPDIAAGKGTIVAFNDVPILNSLRTHLPTILGPQMGDLCAELNYYYNLQKCGIGFHGDSERKIVICARLGADMPMHFQWFHKFKPIGERTSFTLKHGDIYIMTEKAVGTDWKSSSFPTLRHAAGCDKYTTIH